MYLIKKEKEEVFLMKIIHLKRVKMKVTPFGGLLLVHDFIRNISLEALLKDRFPPPGSSRGRSPWQFISSTILMQHAGGREGIHSYVSLSG